jgi:hypothetical protein
MVNHFATLLANMSLKEYNYLVGKYALATNKQLMKAVAIPNRAGAYISLNKKFAYPQVISYQTFLLNQDYVKVNLPIALREFHNLLFSSNSGVYYNQFLLYCYLKLIESTSLSDDVKKYDKRITYRLEEIDEYFSLARVSPVRSTQNAYNLLIFGNPETPDNPEHPVDSITISQVPYTNKVLVYSAIEKKYYKNGVAPSADSEEMQIPLTVPDPSKGITAPVQIGSTGLSFSIGGDLGNLDNSSDFVASPYKTWKFSVEYKMKFDFLDKFNQIEQSQRVVEDMLNYSKTLCNMSYENIWQQHFNSVHRFAGLLMAYVERMNLVWERKLT